MATTSAAPTCTWSTFTLFFVGTLALVTTVFYYASAGFDAVTGTDASLLIAAGVLTSLIVLCACGGACALWSASEPSTSATSGDDAPVSKWRVACFVFGAIAILVAFILGLVALGSLGTSGFAMLIGATVLNGILVLFAVAALCALGAGVI